MCVYISGKPDVIRQFGKSASRNLKQADGARYIKKQYIYIYVYIYMNIYIYIYVCKHIG